jgi:hypothetical protein
MLSFCPKCLPSRSGPCVVILGQSSGAVSTTAPFLPSHLSSLVAPSQADALQGLRHLLIMVLGGMCSWKVCYGLCARELLPGSVLWGCLPTGCMVHREKLGTRCCQPPAHHTLGVIHPAGQG